MEEQLKERVVGAAVLVTAAVIVIPMVLSGPSEAPDPADAATPTTAPFASRVVPLKPDPHLQSARARPDEGGTPSPAPAAPDPASPASARSGAPARAPAAAASRASGVDTPAPAGPKAPAVASRAASSTTASGSASARPPTPEPAPARSATSKPAAPGPAAPKPAAAKPAPNLKLSPTTAPVARAGWVVQLGSFSNERNARGLRDRLLAKGYRAFTDTSSAGGGTVTRVYVGPMSSRDRAKASIPALLQETRLKGIVTRFDG